MEKITLEQSIKELQKAKENVRWLLDHLDGGSVERTVGRISNWTGNDYSILLKRYKP